MEPNCNHEASLTNTLKNIWENYLNAGDELDVKQHWLQLFLYHFQYITENVLQEPDIKSFFNSIPEEICSFLLERVYDIISKSEYYNPTQLDIEIALQENDNDALTKSINNKDVAKLLKSNHNFAQLILRTPSDCNKIVALRTFLTHQLGQHLLQFLLRVNIKLIASQKSLCNLCINLFPNCRWGNKTTDELPIATSISEYLGELQLYDKPQLVAHTRIRSTGLSEHFNDESTKQQWSTAAHESNAKKLSDFKNNTKTSDEIAFIFLQLLTKCVDSESDDALLSEQSMSTTVLNFALEALLFAPSDAFGNLTNAVIIKCKLLQLIGHSLNNLFAHAASTNAIQLQYIVARLIAAMETIKRQETGLSQKVEHLLFGLVYIIFGILNNVVVIFGHMTNTALGSRAQLFTLKFIDEPLLDVCMQILTKLLLQQQRDAEISLLFSSIFKIHIKIIDNLFRYDQQQMQQNIASVALQKPPRRRKFNVRQMHCRIPPTLSCFFQGLLLNILPHVPTQLQEYAVQYFLRSGTCCCHYTLVTITTCFNIVPKVLPHAQKYIYKFIYRKVLNAVFVRDTHQQQQQLPQQTNGKRRTTRNCSKCDSKLRSLEFHNNLLQLYRQLYDQLCQLKENVALTLYLKHLKHISHLLTHDIAAGILAEIVLPIFRHCKQLVLGKPEESPIRLPMNVQIKNSPTTLNSTNLPLKIDRVDDIKILHECLNIFVIYLSDLRLIKAFYNEENIKHLEDLLKQPDLIRTICELIKIGIYNITFLGDHAQEQIALSRRLITLQLSSSDQAAQIFTAMLKHCNSRAPKKSSLFWLDDAPFSNHLTTDTLSLKPLDILHITALQWSLNYELLKSSQLFYNEFAKIYSIVVDDDDEDDEEEIINVDDGAGAGEGGNHTKESRKMCLKRGDKTIIDILKLNYNALSCFLMLPEKKSEVFKHENRRNIFIIGDSSNETDKEIDVLFNSLESLLSNNITSNRCIFIDYPYDFNNIYYENTASFQAESHCQAVRCSSFLHQLKKRQFCHEDSYVLFDIRQQKVSKKEQSNENPKNIQKQSRNILLSNIGFDVTHSRRPTKISSPSSPTAASFADGGIMAKIFSVFGTLFGGNHSNSINENHPRNNEEDAADAGAVNEELKQLSEINGDCKKLLLKLFEATMAISIKGYQNEEEKMQKHLRKLKSLILSNAADNWQQHTEEPTHSQNLITQALQTLLRIAELSNTVNEPAAIVNGVGMRSLADEGITAPTSISGITAASASPGTSETHSHSYISSSRTPLTVISTNTNTNSNAAFNPNNSMLCDSQRPLSSSSPPPPNPFSRPHSGDNSAITDLDYFSTRASVICPDSEVEFSENEHDDFYMTADEGYEADGEIPEISDSEAELETAAAAIDMWTSFQTSSRYRSHVLHSGLCELVVEILIELSYLCAANPLGWCDNLIQLANRLFVIREYLGGPLFLLQGFAPVLECNDERLRELQQSLLELIMDLNTPNVLSTFCNILATKNPPVDILIKYMSHMSAANTQKKPQPNMELEFPIAIDGKCISTSLPFITDQIDQVRNYHLHSQAMTPFTRAPCIIPITNSKLWTNDGFTLSLWVQVKSATLHKSSSQLIDDDTRSSTDEYLKSHLISIGSNHAMLSVYINSSMNLVFETCKPNAQLKLPSPQSDETNDASNNPFTTYTCTSSKYHQKTVATNVNQSLSYPPTSHGQPNGNNAGNSSFRNALKPIKLLMLNSFNHMHFFNGHSSDTDASYFDGSSVDLKYFRISKNKWTHLCFAVDALPDCLTVTAIMDGLEKHVISLPFRNVRFLTRGTQAFQLISLGDGYAVPLKPTNHNTSSFTTRTESRSTIDSYPLRSAISNLMLFNRKITVRETVLNLTAMGPDFHDLTQCQVGNWKPNYGYLNFSKLYSANFGNFTESMKLLRESRILTYTAQHPDVVFGNNSHAHTDPAEAPTYAQQLGLILYGQLTQNPLQSLQTATTLSGGVSTLLYLFARVVEITNNATTQSLALDILLSVSLSDTLLYTEFQRQDYISLIGFIIKTERCTKDVSLLRSIVNNACSQALISKRGTDTLQVNENTSASLIYPRLLISVLHRYADWHRCGADQSDVLDMVLRCIIALTREKHPHKDFNMEQLSKAGLLKEMLNLCKVYVIESPNPVHISKDAAESFVHILSVFAGSPPSPSLMDEIMKLLLLLHKPSECFITHDRSKFYFLLKPQPPPGKDKSASAAASASAANFGRVSAPFRRGFGRAVERSVPNISVTTTGSTSTDAIDAQRAARINKLRKLHARNSPYKQALADFEENLENVADCSRLNKHALRLVSPVEAKKWRLKFKRHSNLNMGVNGSKKLGAPTNHLHKSPTTALLSPIAPKQKISRKRIRFLSFNSMRTMSLTENEKRSLRRRGRDSQNSLQTLGSSLAAYDVSNSSPAEAATESTGCVSSGSPAPKRASKFLTKTDFHNSLGIITLQEGLYKLLKDFLCLLPDSYVEEVLRHYVKMEFLVVLSNHSSCAVRTAIIKLLAALSKRLPSNDIQILIKSSYPQHLANQLTLYPTDVHMFEACLEWVSGLYGSLDAFLQYDFVRIQNRFGLNALLAVLTKPLLNQIEFASKAFKLLQYIYLKDSVQNQSLIECGLLQCCMKALYNIYAPTNVAIHFKTEEAIIELLTKIGEKSLKSVGHMNIIWDILNMLSFYQERESINIMKGFRSVQSQLQLNWINLFFRKNNAPYNFKVASLSGASITLAETKTRLDLLIDRCTQFFTVDATYTPSDNEIKLFELLVSYCLSTNQRCNNFIAWGLQPLRPHALRSFIVDALWTSCQDEFMPSIICDGKMIKSLLWLCLLEDLPQPIPNLVPLCQHLGINESDSTWNLENELERIELNRCNISVKQKALLEKTVYKFEPQAVNCIESSMVLTRRVAELQNAERKLLMSHMKEYDETYIYTKFLDIIRRMTHEGAPWYSKDCTENSWELDDTEGPSRVHTRLRRCHLDIDKRFIMEDYRRTNASSDNTQRIPANSSFIYNDDCYTRPLDYLVSSYDQQLNISFNSQILYNFPAKYLPVDGEIDGEIIVTDHKLYFLATHHCKYFYVCCDIANITEIWLKRYQHQEKAFEIFLDTNRSLFFSLQNQEDWKIMRDVFCDKIVAHPDQSKVLLITQQWREGLLTNWEYLMTLNQIAGRTYNDLMQYPVFPWILSNYTSEVLDLTDSRNFRKLEKPIAVQNEENEQHYINNYSYINNTMTNMGSIILKPYHYSSHYSNSGTVLHFLVRVPPFTSYFLRYQDNNFDLPDRTFHALSTTWGLASRDSPTDVKELIPEFFSLPEMFENFERFNFGCRQSGERVEHVALPPWCARDSRLFILIHRQALECELVRNSLHNWIDLIFGYKQTGDSAVEAINVFHPATYSVFIESEIIDPIERKAVETMIKTYGQMPRQLFKNAHPATKTLNYCLSGDKEIMLSVRGLRWGVYAGSPQLPKPKLGNIYKLSGAEYLVSFNSTNVVYGLPIRSCVMQGAEPDIFNVISWGHEDRIVRIQPLNKMSSKPKNLLYNNAFDDITVCGTDPNCNQLWCGHRSGRISVYKCSSNDALQRTGKSRQSYARGLRLSYNSAFRKITAKNQVKSEADADGDVSSSSSLSTSSMSPTSGGADVAHKDGADLCWSGPTVLVRHTDEITCITLSVEFKIAISAGRDGIAVIWDLNNWSYVRTIERPTEIHHSPISQVAISPTLGDIVTVHTIPFLPSPHSTTPNANSDGSNDRMLDYMSPSASKTRLANAVTSPDECFEVTEENLDDFVNVSIHPNGKSILRLHSVNARYIHHVVNEERIFAVCYSFIKEGVGVNVIATALEGGLVRLWSSWNLSFVADIVTGITNIKNLTYSTHQHLVVLTTESKIQVWETDGLYGNSPKFPQIAYKQSS